MICQAGRAVCAVLHIGSGWPFTAADLVTTALTSSTVVLLARTGYDAPRGAFSVLNGQMPNTKRLGTGGEDIGPIRDDLGLSE